MNKGLVHIYTGSGKGKTTAAIGLAVRAVGSGMSVVFFQFLKGMNTAETTPLEKLDISVHKPAQPKNFVWSMDEKTQKISRDINRKAFLEACEAMQKYNLVVLDEIFACLHAGYITLDELLTCIQGKPPETELVLTGRNAPHEAVALADYVTEMDAKKHPFEKGVQARKGIEF